MCMSQNAAEGIWEVAGAVRMGAEEHVGMWAGKWAQSYLTRQGV